MGFEGVCAQDDKLCKNKSILFRPKAAFKMQTIIIIHGGISRYRCYAFGERHAEYEIAFIVFHSEREHGHGRRTVSKKNTRQKIKTISRVFVGQ